MTAKRKLTKVQLLKVFTKIPNDLMIFMKL